MKLQPRQRRPRPDFIVDNAAALQLGKLFLGWGKARGRRRPRPAQPASVAVKATAKQPPKKTAKASPRAPAKKAATKAPRSAVAAPAAAAPPRRRGRPPKAPAQRSPSPPRTAPQQRASPRLPSPPPPPVRRKTPAARDDRQRKSASPAARTKITTQPLSRRLPVPVPTKKAAASPSPPPSRTQEARANRAVVGRPRRAANAAPPVLPNPVPTPPLSLGSVAGGEPSDSGSVRVLVRTMNGTSCTVQATSETTLHELKRRILEIIMPWTASAAPGLQVRLPMLVMNGRALGPDTATLAALRFSAQSTVYCFPEPN
ncbi:hypothetical protein NESM_000501400 [Novymonas esmeraldas]|uniref:Ubiquitin-like domain-containing protein n=1 Tax=Novymonas esmeraldas TaxID=1808958 RepID=A0AAW0EQB8_9TRYP